MHRPLPTAILSFFYKYYSITFRALFFTFLKLSMQCLDIKVEEEVVTKVGDIQEY